MHKLVLTSHLRQVPRIALRHFHTGVFFRDNNDARQRLEFKQTIKYDVEKCLKKANVNAASDILSKWYNTVYVGEQDLLVSKEEAVADAYLLSNYGQSLSKHSDQRELAQELLERSLGMLEQLAVRTDLSEQEKKEIAECEHFASLCLGLVHQRERRYLAAEEMVLRSLKFRPNDQRLLYMLYSIARQDGDVKRAESHLERIIGHYPNDETVLLNAARFYIEQNNKEKIGLYADKALEISGGRSVEALLIKTHVAHLDGNRSDAKTFLKKALSIDPNEWRAASTLGIMMIRDGKLEEGRGLLKRSLDATNDQPPDVHHTYAHAEHLLEGAKSREITDKYFQMALGIHDEEQRRGAPDDRDITLPLLRNCAHFYLDTGRKSKALPLLERGSKIDSSDPWVLYGFARAAEQSDEPNDQISSKYQAAISQLNQSSSSNIYDLKRLAMDLICRYALFLKKSKEPGNVDELYSKLKDIIGNDLDRSTIDKHEHSLR
jgi:predicted Zn-dependent protease